MKHAAGRPFRWVKTHKRSALTWGLVVLLFVLLGISQIDNSSTPAPLDPNSSAPDGTKAFVALMKQAGAGVTVGANPGHGVAVLLQNNLSKTEAHNIKDWVRQGGTLVVADQTSSLSMATEADTNASQPKTLTARCSNPAAQNVNQIQPNSNANYLLFRSDDSSDNACFPYKSGYFLVEHQQGQGTIIDVGSPDIFMNQDIGHVDNSVLVVDLMQPADGSEITWLQTQDETGAADSGGMSLHDLIPDRVKESLLQLAIAAVVLGLWRSRRLGKPVGEKQLVELAGSQLVMASGNLLQTAGRTADAAETLRADLKRSLSQLLGIEPNADVNVLIQVASERTNIPRERFEAVLVALPVNDTVELISLSQQLEYLHMEVARVR